MVLNIKNIKNNSTPLDFRERAFLPTRLNGFTLIELMVALAISAFLVGGMVLMHQSSRIASIQSDNLSRTQESIRFISEFLVREARNAGFRDQLSLSGKEFDAIGSGIDEGALEGFVTITGDGTELIVRYASLAHCEERLEEAQDLASFPGQAKLVTNRYFVDSNGNFRCAGTDGMNPSASDNDFFTRQGQALVDGVDRIRFEKICPDSTTTCSCKLWTSGDKRDEQKTSLDETCQGVRTTLVMEPIAPDTPEFPVVLTTTFRNVLLGRIKWASVP